MSDKCPNFQLRCSLCEESRSTAKALYWHYKIDHKESHDESFGLVGCAIDERNSLVDDWKEQVKK